eukprot:CAMPEP_0198334338 /NCGR_PEP_ID=MMETSP1450-20131203/19550_1 /TAXON_ID=753684 ORGANISM="Madagascaria erythrocladiodes, Strain CCMP3234" /NCGR_SAMPLE_ID=MMETSP1450 /ASSEMBLY_ACC=CAM_ASM_001115 /LENGTH=168 /DNA_ID=CAMNT_0044038921 /DNA_START=149 /DNA_END=655 /DNA_ORIENTATION=-
MAFAIASGLTATTARAGGAAVCRSRAAARTARRVPAIVMDVGGDKTETPPMDNKAKAEAYDAPSFNVDTEELTNQAKEKAKMVADDVKSRPAFYVQIASAVGVAAVTLTVLQAIINAVNGLPVLPGLFELVGLSYTSWFIWRYLIYNDTRDELVSNVREFVGKTTKKD